MAGYRRADPADAAVAMALKTGFILTEFIETWSI